MKAILEPGQVVIGNTHFDTTRANIEAAQGDALDLPCEEAQDSQTMAPFKGNIDLEKLRMTLRAEGSRVGMLIMTVTNNSVGGQPVSIENLRLASELARSHGVPVFLDCARFAENAYFIKMREEGFSSRSVRDIAQEMFSYVDGALMSMKKDAFANIGGFLAMKDDSLAEKVRSLMVITEGFPTYGGLAGRDMEALAVGLEEITDESYLKYRIRSVDYFARGLVQAGYPVVQPTGGHAVYIDAGRMLPHISSLEYPGQALSVALYESIGIRSVEVGSVMLGYKDANTGREVAAPQELVRLAMPRRVYTQSHVDYMLEMATSLRPHLDKITGFRFIYEPKVLRHFTGRFAPID
jgi:tryptophanase